MRTLAQYKTFSLLEMLQKIRLGKNKKGFADEKCEMLWLLLINQRVNKVLQGNEVTKVLSDHQKRILKFLTKEVTPTRQSLFKKVAEEQTLEKKLRLEVVAKKVLSLEKLFLALTLSMCIPDDLYLVNESLE